MDAFVEASDAEGESEASEDAEGESEASEDAERGA